MGGQHSCIRYFIFWLACLEIAVSLRVMRPTSSDARLTHWGRVNVIIKLLYFAFSKALYRILRRSAVSRPLHLPSML